MEHTAECIQANEAAKAERDEWVALWPKYCQDCDGHGGGLSFYDPSPSGVALSSGSMADWEVCEECWGRCPRCAEPFNTGPNDDECPDACGSCGWKPGHGAPLGYVECFCWLRCPKCGGMNCENEFGVGCRKELA